MNNSAVKDSGLTQGVCCRCSTGVESLLLEIYSLDVTISKELTCKCSLICKCSLSFIVLLVESKD